MSDRVTIQDIADALGVSRNTVSKAINNTGILAESTRVKVLQKAKEMGYKQFSYVSIKDAVSQPPSPNREIALLTTSMLGNSHFSSPMLDNFQKEISQMGYTLTIHLIRQDELDQMKLPFTFHADRVDGIICLEVFHPEYSTLICDLGIPVLFVDSPVNTGNFTLKADCLYMDNYTNVHALVQEMASRGYKDIGFIGEYMHCQSFFERYMAYRQAMYILGLPCKDEYCLIENKKSVINPGSMDYQEYLQSHFQNLKKLPDVFLCANDFVAIDTLQVFKRMGISVPDDVLLCGFDDSPESKVITPSLTTVHIHSRIMGFSAVQLLVSRIKEPSLNYRTMHTETSLIYRESTKD